MALTSRMVESRYRLGDLCNSRKNRRKAPAQLRPEFSSLLLAVSVLFPPVSLRRRQAACPQTPTLRSARCVYHVGLCVCVCVFGGSQETLASRHSKDTWRQQHSDLPVRDNVDDPSPLCPSCFFFVLFLSLVRYHQLVKETRQSLD